MPGIYLSWPFCAQKCTYCNFASGVQADGLEQQYLQALVAEINRHQWAWRPETLYAGGGTPSTIEPDAIERILGCLPGRPWREATMEAAPGSLSAAKIAVWKCCGINRVSLGVQSFNRAELARTGRKHDALTVVHDVAMLREAGIENINIDLIAGLPAQTDESWRASVAAVVELGTPHVSVYMLEVDHDSRLGEEILLGGKRYGALNVPSDDHIADFYEYAVDELARNGIQRYEISNFAQRGAESVHNMKYWKREPYVGFGADAHSFDGALRSQNAETAREYVDAAGVREPTEVDAGEEKFMVGLRLSEGVPTDPSDWRRYGAAFQRFLEAGLMEQTDGRLRLTPRGVMVSNDIFQEFLPA